MDKVIVYLIVLGLSVCFIGLAKDVIQHHNAPPSNETPLVNVDE